MHLQTTRLYQWNEVRCKAGGQAQSPGVRTPKRTTILLDWLAPILTD